ncbi:MAG: hypothetical protein CMO80_14705 [Verrucomicrobiales bacterium]|nr:hypothetical protein [Verrucomicrobiales bacterium]|tara:strand:+ start:2480 stop:3691 length:1212 start_codon:yes stop_codon:yes gene_type:complete
MKKHLTLAIAGVVLSGLVTASAQRITSVTRAAQSCWLLKSDQVELAITKTGGHMAPVTFYRDNGPVAPYYISPWQGETHDYPVGVLVPLRGDFFCMPFGGNGGEYQGESHPPHGETSEARWTAVGTSKKHGVSSLTLELNTKVRAGRVTKKLHLVDGQNVVYTSHRIEGFEGKTSLGHHATLAMPEKEGSFKINHSPIKFGMTNPGQFSNPANGEYQQLGIKQRFNSLSAVPSIFKGAPDVDCSKLPQKKGYADLLMIFPADTAGKPAWLTATRADEGWLWFSLKDPKVLASTVFWLENRGRHMLPWYGRNNCVGLEDVTAFFADGVKPSASDNLLTQDGIQTAVDLKGDFTVNYIQGVVKIPDGFTEVANVEFAGGVATFVSTGGHRVTTAVRHEFLKSGQF